MLATLKAELGDLDKIDQVIKLVGFVNCVDGFPDSPKVNVARFQPSPALLKSFSLRFASMFTTFCAGNQRNLRSLR